MALGLLLADLTVGLCPRGFRAVCEPQLEALPDAPGLYPPSQGRAAQCLPFLDLQSLLRLVPWAAKTSVRWTILGSGWKLSNQMLYTPALPFISYRAWGKLLSLPKL